jgi:opacity protein-like surface antigen
MRVERPREGCGEMKQIVITTCAGALLMLAGAAWGQDEFARSGFYVGAGWSRAVEDFDDIDPLDVDDGRSINVMLGYRINRYLGAELEFEDVDELDGNASVLGSNVSLDTEIWTLSLIGKLYPFAGRFQPYVLGGFGYMDGEAELSVAVLGLDVDGDDSTTVAQAGAENIVFEIEYSYKFPTHDLDEFEYWTLGGSLIYRF